MESQRTKNAQNNFEKHKFRKLILPLFKTYYKGTIIITAWYWHKVIQIAQWNRNECSKTDPGIYNELVFKRDAKTIY